MYREIRKGRTIMGRLAKGADLLSALEQVCRETGVRLGELTAIGAVGKARVGYYDQERQGYAFEQWDRPLEILSLVGNVSLKDGEPFVHAHVTLADERGRGFGGHLAEGTTVFACEFVLREYLSEKDYVRVPDAHTGLSLWEDAE